MGMKGVWLFAVLLAAALLVGVEVGWAQEEEAQAAKPAEPTPYALLGQIASVEGDVFVLHEEGGETVRFTVTPETIGHGRFKAGDRVIASVWPDGKASAITGMFESEGGTAEPMTQTSPPESS